MPQKLLMFSGWRNWEQWLETNIAWILIKLQDAHLEPSHTSQMELFGITINTSNIFAIFTKSFILDVWFDSECAPDSPICFKTLKVFSLERKLVLNHFCTSFTAQKIKFSVKDFCSKRDEINSFLRIWSH